jgi:hypothetical protein
MNPYKIGAALVLWLSLIAGAVDARTNPGIAPIQSKPHGQTYSAWAAQWWQWALEIPASVNPVLDMTGQYCAQGQSNHVWFLAGLFFGGGSVTRTCTVPTGTALFLPLINSAYFAFLTDPPEQRTEAFLRSQVTCVEDAVFSFVEIDGVAISDPQQYLEKSVLFDVVLPTDNVFGATAADIPELTLSPSVDEGFYLFVLPLPPGSHTIRWRASSAACGTVQDITYHLTVK